MTVYSPFTHVALANWANALLRELEDSEADDDTIGLTIQLTNIHNEMARRGFKAHFTIRYRRVTTKT